MKKTLTTLFLVLAICLNSKATNYYIAASGNDANNGTSTSTPWKTLNKLNSYVSSLKSGDNVYLNRGDIFYGTITINNKSGLSGSPITIGAYGSGANPIVTGFTTVSSWTNLGGNIWESSSAVSTLSTCNIVAVNGVNTPMGRYPNSGWLTYQSHSGTTSITSNQLSGSPNWAGAESVTRIIRFVLQREVITSQSGGTITFAGDGGTPTDGYGFFIQNDARTLDAQNEWYYNPSTKKIRVYSSGSPSNVQMATINELVLTSGSNYITFDHIDFKGANSYLFENKNGRYITVQNCSFSLSGQFGIYISNQTAGNETMTIDSNLFNDINENAMNFLGYGTNIWIKNNTINNTGIIPGSASNNGSDYDAIVVSGANSIVEYNTINNIGHMGISMRTSDGIIIRNNYISYFGMTKYDAGAIYSWNATTNTVKSRVIDHNIIVYANPKNEGIASGPPLLFGIYLDGSSNNTTITNNTVAHCLAGDGIHILNSGSCTISNNVSFDNGNQFALLHAFGGGTPTSGLVVNGNTFFAKTKSQATLYFRDDDNTLFNKFGTADNNYYARPMDDNSDITTQVVYAALNRTLAGWQLLSGQDAHSKKSPKSITDTNDLRFEYNATSSSKTIALPYNYIDVKNNSYNGTVTLAPYTSIVLIKNGAAIVNQLPVANAGNDQTITLPTNTVTLSGSGSGGSGTISSYNWTKISGPSEGTITNTSSAASTVTALVQGIYQFQLKVTDNAGATDMDTVQVTVNASAGSLLPSVYPANTVNGLNYSYYEASGFSAVPDFTSLTSVKAGSVSNFDISVANRTDEFAINFVGYINIPSDGQYTFYTTSDDGSKLYIDNVPVVNNDGIHSSAEQSGTIGLKAGMHAISLGFFQQTGGQTLSVSYSGPGISKKVIPASALFRISSGGTNGLNYSYYEGSYSTIPVFSNFTPVKQGITSTFNIGLANRADQFAFNFAGFINIPTAGQYTFYTTSDDGSDLYIDNMRVVNNDGIHSSRERSGTITLTAGMHAISVGFFEYTVGQVLAVSYAGPGISKQLIPASVLFTSSGLGTNTIALDNNSIAPSIAPSSTKLGVQAYPNPFTNFIQVNINGDAGNYQLALVDISGKILWIKSGVKNAGAFMQLVNTSSLQRGIYFLKVIQNNNTSVIKLVK